MTVPDPGAPREATNVDVPGEGRVRVAGGGPGEVHIEAIGRSGHPARLVREVPGGPALVEGPVGLVTAEGARVCSDRFMVAVCTCRRSKLFPLCDTSHRRKVRADRSSGD